MYNGSINIEKGDIMTKKPKTFAEYMSIGLRERAPEMEIGPEGHMHSPAHKWWMKELHRLAPQTVRTMKWV